MQCYLLFLCSKNIITITFIQVCLSVCVASGALALNGEKRFAKSSINETPHLTRSSPQYNVLCMCLRCVVLGKIKRYTYAEGQRHRESTAQRTQSN